MGIQDKLDLWIKNLRDEYIKASEEEREAIAERGKKLKREPCIVCGDLKVEGHHPDYSKPLEVIWFCKKHHRQVDGPQPRLFRFSYWE